MHSINRAPLVLRAWMKTVSSVLILSGFAGICSAEGLQICQLKTDKWVIYNPYTACLSGYGEISERMLAKEDTNRLKGGYLGQLYGSIGLGHWLSLHVRGGFRQLADPDSDEFAKYSRTEQGYVQLGHPISDPIYLSMGRIDAPFGLNHDMYRLSLPSRGRALWISSVNGGRLGFGWRDELRLELGTSNLNQDDPVTGKQRKVLSSRLIRAIDLLNGAKLMASYAASSDYRQRRMGMATLVHNYENRTSLEWVRQTDSETPDVFQQIFRFVHEQQEGNWAWNLAMEEFRRNSYRLSFGLTRPWPRMLFSTLSVHYQKENLEPRDHWVVMAGLGFGTAWAWEEKDP